MERQHGRGYRHGFLVGCSGHGCDGSSSLILFGCIVVLALLSLFSSVVIGGPDPEEIILPPNTLMTQTLAANSSICYDIPIVENLQYGTIAYTLKLIVTKLPGEDPRSTLDLYMSRNPYRLASKKYHDYSATTGNPWKIEVQDTSWSNVLWNACVYSSSLPISFTVQTTVLTYDPFPVSYGAPVPVVVQPGQYFFYQVNSSLIPETDWSLNVTLDNGNKKDGVKLYLSYEYIPRQNDYDYSGYGYVAVPFPSHKTLFITLQNKGPTDYHGTLLASAGVIPNTVISLNTPVFVDLEDSLEILQLPVTVSSGQYRNLKLSMSVRDGDPDLYVGTNYIPTSDNYDFHDSSYESRFEINILVDTSTTFYLLFQAFEDESSGTFTASLQPFQFQSASNNTLITLPASTTDMQYVAFDVPTEFSGPENALLVETLSWSGKSTSLYLQSGTAPTKQDFLTRIGVQDSSYNYIYLPGPQEGRWYVMIDSQKVKTSFTVKFSVFPQVVTELKGAWIVNRTGDENTPAANFFKYTVTDPIDYLTVIVDQPAILYYEWNASPTRNSNYVWYYNQLPAITFPNPNGTWYFSTGDPEDSYGILGVGAKVTPLNLDCSITSDSGQIGQWKYYSFTIQTLKFVDIEITTGVTSGLDLYVLADNLPTVFFWEHSASGSGKNKLSFFLPPDHNGTYFLGLFMTATTSFSLSVCPKDPNVPSMTSGVTYNRTLDMTDDYYFIDVVDPNVDVIVLSVNDSDYVALYLSQDVLPTQPKYYYYSYTTSYLMAPSLGRYYLAVHRTASSRKTGLTYSLRCLMKNKEQVATPLESGKPMLGEVSKGDFTFFSIFVGNASTPVTVTLTPISSYLYLYADYAKLPNTTDYRYQGVTLESRTILAFQPSLGMYYFCIAGNYWYSTPVAFSILATFDSNRVPAPLSNGIQQNFQVFNNLWKDFSVDVEFGSMLMIQFPKIDLNSNVVVYVRFQSLSTTQQYLRKSSTGSSIIYISEPDYGTYYISVFSGNQSLSSFPFSITTFIGGSCEDRVGCVCPSDRDDCSQIISGLDDGGVYNGFVDEGSWVHYMLTIDHGTDLLINFQTSFATRDQVYCYVRFGAIPTNMTYDYVMSLNPTQRSLRIMDPQFGVTYISVFGADVIQYAKFSVTTSLVEFGSCPNHCSGHGNCSNSGCSCDPNWSADDCSVYQNKIPSEISFDAYGHLRTGFFNYFTVVGSPGAPSSLDLYVQVLLSGSLTTGSVELYVKSGDDLPTTESFDLSSKNGTSDLVVVPKMSAGKVVQIAVYCSSGPVDYYLTVLPVEAAGHSSFMTVFVILLVVFLFGAGFYFFKKNKDNILPVIQRLTTGSSSSSHHSPNNRRGRRSKGAGLLEDQDEEELEDEGSRSRITQEDAFASALTRAVSTDGKEEAEEEEESGGRGKGRGDEENPLKEFTNLSETSTTTTQRDFLDL